MAYSYRIIVDILKAAGIKSANYDAKLLINKFCGLSIAAIASEPDRVYVSDELERAVKKRESRYPLQYILGEVVFLNGIFRVSSKTLIPRPDTEMIAEYAIGNMPCNGTFADICTGSGCIAISVLMERSDIFGIATDIDFETLNLAAENALKNGVSSRLTLFRADAKEPISIIDHAPFDMIISNPPYIPTDEIETLEPEIKCEPFAAFDGGADGMDFYRAMIPGYLPYLKPEGRIVFEIGYDQGRRIEGLARENGLRCKIFKDYGGNDRMAVIDRKKG